MYSLCYRYSGCVVAVPPGRMWALAGRERRVSGGAGGVVLVPWCAPGREASIFILILVNKIVAT